MLIPVVKKFPNKIMSWYGGYTGNRDDNGNFGSIKLL